MMFTRRGEAIGAGSGHVWTMEIYGFSVTSVVRVCSGLASLAVSARL